MKCLFFDLNFMEAYLFIFRKTKIIHKCHWSILILQLNIYFQEIECFFKKEKKVIGLNNLVSIKKKITSNNFSILLRNILSIKPSLYNNSKNIKESISDFFFWDQTDDNDTKFILTNICSHVLPEINQNDDVSIFIFNFDGKLIKEKNIRLSPFETAHIYFNDPDLKGKFGSFFVFHKFKEFGQLISNNCQIAERGYSGFRQDKGLWNFVHGNHYAAAINKRNKIYSLLSKTFFKTTYRMQLSTSDTDNFSIILNNPSSNDINVIFILYGEKKNLKISKKLKIKSFCTEVTDFKNKNISYLEIKSNLMMCRPLIKKYYKTYFDVFHC